jgi:hypothetical protein
MVWSVAGSTRGESDGPGRSGADPAVLQARRVVGLYGDPDVTWSVVLALRLREARSAEAIASAARTLVRDHPHLGPVPDIEGWAPDGEGPALAAYANEPYGDAGPLLRIALSADGHDVLLAAHHGVVDGLGLLGVAAALIDVPLTSNARGIPRESEPTGFVRGSVRRLVEAAFTPPVRIAGDRRATADASGDWLESRDVVVTRPGSAALVCAATDLVRRTSPVRRRGRLVVSMGLSRRPGTPVPAPDRDTAYARLSADDVRSTEDARALVARTPPEPAFPVSDGGGLWPRIARLLSGRLGATVLVSNLGLVDNPTVEAIRFWPVPTGPAGVCLGLASTPGTTTLTVRARRGWFSEGATGTLADVAAECLGRAAQ